MAQFNADVLLDLQTTKAERQIKKFTRQVDRLDRKASDIDVKFDISDREIRRANRLLNNLTCNRVVKLKIDEQVIRSGGANAASGAISGAAFGAAASAIQPAKQLETAFEQTAENAK